MPDGFKIADAYVEIHARGEDRVGRQVRDTVRNDRSFEAAGADAGARFSRGFNDGVNRGGVATHMRNLGTAAGRHFRDGLFGAIGNIGQALTSTIKWTVIGGAIAGLGAHAASAAVPVIALAGELTKLGGLMAAVPGVALTGAAAFGVWKLAAGGLSEAMSATLSGNLEAQAAAMSKLTERGRALISEFDGALAMLNQFKRFAQDPFVEPLIGQIERWITSARVLGPAISSLAAEMGLLIRQALDFATSDHALAQFNVVLGDTSRLFGAIRTAFQPLLTGFTDLGVVGSNWLASMSGGLSNVLTTWGQWMSEVARSGQALQWINNAVEVLGQVWRLAGDLVGIFRGLFQAMETAGGGALGILGQLTRQLNLFFASAEGQDILVTIFRALMDIGSAFMPVIRALASAIATLAPTVADLAEALGPLLADAINAVAPALRELGPGILAVFNNLRQAVQALSPALPVLARAFSGVMAAAAPLLPTIANLAVQVINTLAPALPPLTAALVSVLQALSPLGVAIAQVARVVADQLTRAIEAVAPYLPDLARALGELLIALTPLIPPITQLVIALTPLIPVITDMISLLAQLATAVMPALTTAINLNATATQILVNVISAAWAFIRDYIVLAIEQIRNAVNWFFDLPANWDAIWSAIRTYVSSAWDNIRSTVSSVIDDIRARIENALSVIRSIWDVTWSNIRTYVSSTWDNIRSTVSSVIDNIRSTISNALNAIRSAWSSAWDSARNTVVETWNRIRSAVIDGVNNVLAIARALPGQIVSSLGNLGGLLWNSGRSIIQGLIDGLWSKFGDLWNTAVDILNRIRSLFPFSPAKVGPFSGRGWVEYSGRSVAEGFARGMTSGMHEVNTAAAGIINAAAAPVGVTPASITPAAVAAAAPAPAPVRSIHIGQLSLNMQAVVDLRNPSGAARQFLLDVRDALRQLEMEYA